MLVDSAIPPASAQAMTASPLASPAPAASRADDARPTICQIVHCLSVGGAELLAADISRRLRERFRFVFVCLDELGPLGDALRSEGFPVHVLNRKPGIDLGCARRLAAVFQVEQVEAVHAHQYTPFFQSALARRFSARPRILFTEHGRHFPDTRSWKRVIVNRLITRRGDHVVGVGDAVREALIANEGFARDRVGVVFNGVDLRPLLAARATHREAARRELGLDDAFVLMQVARLNPLKDHATALRTLARVLPEVPRARLVLVGDGEERANIEALVKELRLESAVRMLGTRRDIPYLLAAADMFLMTSVSEGIPLTIIEAMGAGLPVVSTDVGGIAEIIENGRTGHLTEAGDDADLARHVVSLARSPQTREEQGRAGRDRAVARFARERMDDAYGKLYEEMLRG